MQINKTFKKIVAMTLAEVLVTLGILGTVFALTVPTLKGNADKRKMETLVKKSFLMVNQAIDMSLANDPEDEVGKWNFSSNSDMFNRLTKYLNVQKICPGGSKECFAKTYKFFSNGNVYSGIDFSATRSAILSGNIAYQVNQCDGSMCHIHVDVNGPEEPNVIGYDYFEFVFYKDSRGLTYHGGNDDFSKSQSIMENEWTITYF